MYHVPVSKVNIEVGCIHVVKIFVMRIEHNSAEL